MITKTKTQEKLNGANGATSHKVLRTRPLIPAKPPPKEDPFRYGWRTVTETLPDGTVISQDVPLIQADFLNPQWGDHFLQSDPHFVTVNSIYNRFKKRYRHHPTVGVFSDLKMEWDIPAKKEPVPDLAVVLNLKNTEAERSTFDVRKEGTAPDLLVEVVSPLYPGDDTDKVTIYGQAGIREYIVVNPHFGKADAKITLKGWRLVEGSLQEVKPDEQDRLLSETTGVWFALDASKKRLLLIDAATGKLLLTEEQEEEARAQAELRAEEERQARLVAEARVREEEQARLAAEAQAATLADEVARLKALLGK